MEMKIIPANEGGPGMDGVFLSGYGDGDYTPRPRSGPQPSLATWKPQPIQETIQPLPKLASAKDWGGGGGGGATDGVQNSMCTSLERKPRT